VSEAGRLLRCRQLDVAVPGRSLVTALDLEARPGRFIAILGRNGAGKTLTLHTLAGLRPPDGGRVDLGARAIADWRAADRARRLGLLPQSVEDPFPSTVLETALIGRHPHIEFWRWEDADDVAVARAALAAVDLAGWESRAVDTLSGGERRRLAIATLLAQDPAVCLLDEPTNHLDPRHQFDVLALFRARTERGGTVLASLHDPTMAARYADDALLLHGDGRWDFGPCEEVLTPALLSALYDSPVHELAWQGRRIFIGG